MVIDHFDILLPAIIMIMSVVTFLLFGVDKRRAVRHVWRIPEKTLLACSLLLGGTGGLLGMILFRHKTRKWAFRILIPMFAIIQGFLLVFFLWASYYYPADQTAKQAMQSDDRVTVSETASGWLFDGPSETSALIFYPGAKVEETAYAPMLHHLADETMDVFLVKMPLRLAFFGMNRAADIQDQTSYMHYYIGGHSLGGAMAAEYASSDAKSPDGLVLLAAYPVKQLPESMDVLLLYGSEDRVLNMKKVEEAESFVSGNYRECRLEGGNHAQFGHYGKQKGDGEALISTEEQQVQAIHCIRETFITDASF